ncbi:S8 family serine peptidase [Paenibacillus yanchengensis]
MKQNEKQIKFYKIILLVIVIAVASLLYDKPMLVSAADVAETKRNDKLQSVSEEMLEQTDSWMIKWHSAEDMRELPGVTIRKEQKETAVQEVVPSDPGVDITYWLSQLAEQSDITYIHPNLPVHVLQQDIEQQLEKQAKVAAVAAPTTRPNDPHLEKQTYLRQIGAFEAWKTVREQTELKIAVVDTGIDLNHADLSANLIAGYNVLAPNKLPQDDNGHGTGVAGVIAAAGNNGIGIAGILWNAKLMPVKALDQNGDGTERDLGEGILQAVRGGADIVVLSVGLYEHSPYMEDIANYAEGQGVLLIAAAGNDGQQLGGRIAVKYPAAYPTVLAVGGATTDNKADLRTNSGPELDLIAPWKVYTTKLGGGYHYDEGTSLAAPQVAAAAALVWGQDRQMKPYEVRTLLKQTARDIGSKGHDNLSGYGLLQVDLAVKAKTKLDHREPNNSEKSASKLPLQAKEQAELSNSVDQDWYYVEAPYSGEVVLKYEAILPKGKSFDPVVVTQLVNGKVRQSETVKTNGKSITFAVNEGKHHFKIAFANPKSATKQAYVLTNQFRMKADRYEPNDKMSQAYVLPPRTQQVVGNFHKQADRDWYVVEFKHHGELTISLSTDTVRIDPSIAVQRSTGKLTVYDKQGDGKTEYTPVIDVAPGRYYIRVYNAVSSEASATNGEYKLNMEYNRTYSDPNEPNNRSQDATTLKRGVEHLGVFASSGDSDWFTFRLDKDSTSQINITGIPESVSVKLELFNKKMTKLQTTYSNKQGTLNTEARVMQSGVYYVKLVSDQSFDHQFYRLNWSYEHLVAGYRDVSNHWAKKEIVALTNRKIIQGMGNYRFAPDHSITRAEAVSMIVKAYKPIATSAAKRKFTDVTQQHWASQSIARAVAQEWIDGFPNGTFRPDQPITRAEMAALIARAEKLQLFTPYFKPFSDVAISDWYAPVLHTMKGAKKIEGDASNQYRPKGKASRADFAVLLYRYVVEK